MALVVVGHGLGVVGSWHVVGFFHAVWRERERVGMAWQGVSGVLPIPSSSAWQFGTALDQS